MNFFVGNTTVACNKKGFLNNLKLICSKLEVKFWIFYISKLQKVISADDQVQLGKIGLFQCINDNLKLLTVISDDSEFI